MSPSCSLPQFPLRREHYGYLHTFKADIGLLIICMGFQDLLQGVLGEDKMGEGVVQY